MIASVKGTQDILNTHLLNFLLTQARSHFAGYQYAEIITPMLEYAELFQRSVGQETDIVSKEMYLVHSEHESKQKALCLRPEITASIMRAFLEHSIQTLPWKVFTYGHCFRHERPQKGRYREFAQISLEIIGAHSIFHDIQCITMLERFFSEKLKLNSYALLLNFLGCTADRTHFRTELATFLAQHASQLCSTCLERKDRNVLRTFDCKNLACQQLYANAPLLEKFLCTHCAEEWQLIQRTLRELSVSFTVAPRLVRGLDYYNKTVFEFVSVDSALGTQSTFCGGGRYDSLAQQLGSKTDYPSIGAALGIERLLLMLETIKDRLPLPTAPTLHVIAPQSEKETTLALHIADTLHAAGISAEIFLDGGSFKSMLRRADKLGAKTCILIGPEELQGHYVTVKQMMLGTEEKVGQRELVDYLRR